MNTWIRTFILISSSATRRMERGMKAALLLALALTATGASAETARLLLLNAGSAVIQVQDDGRAVVAVIQPGANATVSFNQPQWMRMGKKGYRYNTLPVMRLKRKGKDIVLQLGPNETLYLMPPGTSVPGSKPPSQPKGFPIRPDRVFNLN